MGENKKVVVRHKGRVDSAPQLAGEHLMEQSFSSHAIAPAAVLRGEGAWSEALPRIRDLCSKPLLLGRSTSTSRLRHQLMADLSAAGLNPAWAELRFDCCEQDLNAGKLLAHRLSVPCVTVPLTKQKVKAKQEEK